VRAAEDPVSHIHATAIVSAGAELADDVTVGAFAVIGPQVTIGSGTRVGPHVVIDGRTRIGPRNEIFQFASVGAMPQDLKYQGEQSELVIGAGNRIREFCSLHPGTSGGGMFTRIGNENMLMNYTHIAHDCTLGDHNVLANGAQLGGHVVIEDFAVIGALSGVHQFARVGESAIVGAGSMVSQDVPPFCNVAGDRARLLGLNTIGLKRRGISDDAARALKRAYRLMFQSKLRVAEGAGQVRQAIAGVPEVERLVAFVESSERGVCR